MVERLSRRERDLIQYFEMYKESIAHVISAYNHTSFGMRNPVPIARSYREFSSFPFMEGDILSHSPEDLHIPAANEIRCHTSGTSGMHKIVYIPEGQPPPFVPQIQERIQSSNAVFVHTTCGEDDLFYWLRERMRSQLFPQTPIKTYYDTQTALALTRSADVLYVYDYPSALARFFFFIRDAITANLTDPQELWGKQLIMDLSGEPISVDLLTHITMQSQEIFRTMPLIRLLYGTTEARNIGIIQEWQPEQQLLYTINRSTFVEVIDEARGIPVVGKVGEIVATPLRTSGTVLIRYKTGDLGIMYFTDGQPTLEVFGKKPSEGVVYVGGGQFYLPHFLSELMRHFGVPLQIEAGSKKHVEEGTETLTIHIYLPSNCSIEEDEIQEATREFVKKQTDLDAGFDPQLESPTVFFNIQIHFVKEDNTRLRKGWARMT